MKLSHRRSTYKYRVVTLDLAERRVIPLRTITKRQDRRLAGIEIKGVRLHEILEAAAKDYAT